jgi:lipopolysaccharide transport system ATP-binding protein
MLKHAFGFAKPGEDYDVVESLKNINVEIEEGKVHGIIGMNGAGKSTLLKILTGVIHQTSGSFHLKGRVAALLELGTGFHGELTGRQNVYLNGSIMGLTKQEVENKISEIQAFAELGDFFDRPVKIYSSGMYVRLAFSFAVSVEPDVLIIDEALSVGDAYFQQKCLKKIETFKDSGTTILFVSHDLGAVRTLCESVTLLDRGKELFSGSPMQALDLYNDLLSDFHDQKLLQEKAVAAKDISAGSSYESGTREIEVTRTVMRNTAGKEGQVFNSGDAVSICVEAEVKSEVQEKDITCGILVRDRLGYDVFGTNTYNLGQALKAERIGQKMKIRFDFDLNIGPGNYVLTVAIHSHKSHVDKNYHWIERALIFKVLPSLDYEFVGVARLTPQCGVISGG